MDYHAAPPSNKEGHQGFEGQIRRRPDRRTAAGVGEADGTCRHAASLITRARILLKAEAEGGGWADDRIAEAPDVSVAIVARARKKFAFGGLASAIERRRPTGRQHRKLDGTQDARLAALACGPPPDCRGRWAMELLTDKLVESIDPATVCRTLKKRDHALAEAAVGPAAEAECRLRRGDGRCAGGLCPPLRPRREDYEYVRNGTANLFMAFEPWRGRGASR